MILYVNGFLIENISKNIAQTKQVNTIGSIETRQTNYTNAGTFPKTANNVRAVEYLGVVGNSSTVPYKKNNCFLFSDTGECFVYDGWCVISETANEKEYRYNIYDGVLELFKVIENVPLSAVDISELAHEKTLANVLATFDDSKPYKYILADYNGKCLYDTNKINIDYLVPSVRASFLMEKIEEYSGFLLNGSYKANTDFTNLYLSYPKGSTQPTTTLILSSTVKTSPTILEVLTYTTQTADFSTVDNLYFIAQKDMKIRVTIDVNIKIRDVFFSSVHYEGILKMRLNGVDFNMAVINKNPSNIVQTIVFEYELYENDSISFFATQRFGDPVAEYKGGSFVSLLIEERNPDEIDFTSELNGMTIKEFVKEVLWRFGLTMFKQKYSSVYDLKPLDEILDISTAEDWSDKFDRVDSEKYVFESYCQKNLFVPRYNQDSSFYNNGSLNVANDNLDDEKIVVQSKLFSPDEFQTTNLGVISKVYRLWEKENKDNGSVVYKPKANHFYFLRSIDRTIASTSIGSESLGVSSLITEAPFESYAGMTWQETVNKNYAKMRDILDSSKMIVAKMKLTDLDVSNVDFSTPKYIKQLSSYFLLNKISNFVPKEKTKCELVRITVNSQIPITTGDFSPDDFSGADFFLT